MNAITETLSVLTGKLRRTPLLNVALLLATFGTTTWVGAAHAGISPWRDPAAWWSAGLPYALGILFILGVHEMGHYLAARYHRVPVSLPYFIPMPLGLGTLGAFIRMEQDPRDRRKLFDIAVAGPLAGLVAALGVLAVAFLWAPAPADSYGMPPSHSLAFAGRLGLMLTAFNLLPVGQLDGGHMARALFGDRTATWIARVALGALITLGLLVWHGLLLWAVVAFALGGGVAGEAEPDAPRGLLGDVRRQAVGAAAFALVALILVAPVPGSGSVLTHAACPPAADLPRQ